MTVRILNGDCRAVVRLLPSNSVHACVCSPPYFRLRDYKMAGQIGLENSPEAYIAELVDLFREIRRVLRDDGSLWINIGDCYAGSGRGGNPAAASSTLLGTLQSQEASMVVRQNWEIGASSRTAAQTERGSRVPAGLQAKAQGDGAIGRAWEPAPGGLKQKDLIGIPWMLAFALRADGWWLRKDNIWAKPNGMPESTRDRSTSAHEYVFHLTKSETYYHGYEDVRLPAAPESVTRLARAMRDRLGAEDGGLVVSGGGYAPDGQPPHAGARKRDRQRGHGRRHAGFNDRWDGMSVAEQRANGAALRSVWWVAPGGFNDEFCTGCRRFYPSAEVGRLRAEKIERDGRKVTLRYCECGSHEDWLNHFAVMPPEVAAVCILAGVPPGGTVLDPFAGAGTTGLVADRLQRDAILIELNADYAEMAAKRISASHPMLTSVELEAVPA
ncbi:site-specific DNA-methyltransferase [Bradyrhizobium sp. C9]|uniref:DNA-methyltransferase n=1 Tax=Bradyrhizobium sp. C9 TaxID=142585 RepID=UPI0013043FB3|nr:site-specific DNA-methyltransferase [Bradyrhizobium sp. C9]